MFETLESKYKDSHKTVKRMPLSDNLCWSSFSGAFYEKCFFFIFFVVFLLRNKTRVVPRRLDILMSYREKRYFYFHFFLTFSLYKR